MTQDTLSSTPTEARRSFLKVAGVAVAAPLILTPRKTNAQQPLLPPSPSTMPWLEELPTQITPLQEVSLDPYPGLSANSQGGECGRGDHDRFYDFGSALALYELRAKQNASWVFNPALPTQPTWGFEGYTPGATTPGPTIFARYGRPVVCRIHNELPQNHTGFGSPEIATHLHNQHGPSGSDGFAGDYYSPTRAGPTMGGPGRFHDHFWPNVYAGYDSYGGLGDPREALGTLWYHNHTMDVTAANVVRGLLGFYLLFDDLDSGDEYDSNGLRLPSWPYDYPIALTDKRFDADGVLYFDPFHPEGTLGDKVCVNGKIEPVLRVARRKYRLRLLNGGPSRFYELYLTNKSRSTTYTFSYIANDGNLLPAPLLNQFKVRLGMAERADIVVDFSRFPLGTELFLVNRLLQDNTRKPGNVKAPGTPVLKLVVDRNPPQPDVSRVPSVLRPLPPLDPTEIAAAPVRTWRFNRTNGMWAVNGRFFDARTPRATPKLGSAEVWEFINPEDGWLHPIHVHFEEGRILSKTVRGVNVPIPAHERGRKDVFVLDEDMRMRVFLRFRDFTGRYLMHCHNLTHEDHAMMVRFDVVP
jgi:FtsP/CotA-like multicopper oxidase with cupredoxin domain